MLVEEVVCALYDVELSLELENKLLYDVKDVLLTAEVVLVLVAELVLALVSEVVLVAEVACALDDVKLSPKVDEKLLNDVEDPLTVEESVARTLEVKTELEDAALSTPTDVA